MKIFTLWLRQFLPPLAVSDRELADDLTLRGIAVEGVHDLGPGAGSLFEMDITTNRVDAMNHFGIAREAAAIYNLPLTPLHADLPDPTPTTTPFPVRIDPAVAHLCGRFTARVLRDVRIADSAGDVRRYFDLLGQRPISNVVDASNFTLLGMGHPTHAFDLDRIAGGIVVRFAHPGEHLRLLDGTERTLAPDDLVIADHDRALSLAGVMGGWDSMITPATRNILVEAAWFDPASIRRSARRHGLHTDASHRFERGADFNAAPLANDLVSSLILASGGTLEGDRIDLRSPAVEARTVQRPPVTLTVDQVQSTLGATLADQDNRSALSPELIARTLTALGCTLPPADPPPDPIERAGSNPSRGLLHTHDEPRPTGVFSVTLPSWRLDLERPIDLIEEVARVFGYNRFQNTLPVALPVRGQPTARAEGLVRARLLALGFTEAVSSTFANTADSELFAPLSSEIEPAGAPLSRNTGTRSAAAHVPLENPLSEEVSNLRPSLVPGMLSMLGHNFNRGVSSVRLFEQGHVFRGNLATSDPQNAVAINEVAESLELALGLTAASSAASSLHRPSEVPLFDLKGAVTSLASLFDLAAAPLRFTTASTPAWFDPARSATALLGDAVFAHFGELSAPETARRKLRQPVFLATVDLSLLLSLPLRQPVARELSRFQAVERDFSFVFPDRATWAEIESAIHALALPELQSLAPVEIFRDPRGKTVSAGSYSLLLRVVLQSPARTLTEDDLTAASDRILAALTALGGTHRGESTAAASAHPPLATHQA